MKIANNTSPRSKTALLKYAVAVIVAALVGYGLYSLLGYESGNQDAQVYICNAEKYEDGAFYYDDFRFGTSCAQDVEIKASGDASCRCEGEQRFGPTAILTHLVLNDTIAMSIKVLAKGNTETRIVISSDLEDYHTVTLPTRPDQWQQHHISYVIPKGGATWSIYPYMALGNGPVYFDDIRITINQDENIVTQTDFPLLEMQINSDNFSKIKQKRREAQEVGLLFSSKADLVPADFKVEGKTYSCQTRLKGDLLDHLRSNKWSFRVMMDGKETWRGMNVFSIHNSMARSHLAEWVMHQMMSMEGILTPQYDFMRFHLNNKEIGVYAYEQHFDNYFLLDNERVVAPIIRHNDDGYWNNVQGNLKEYEWAEASQIELFNKENESDSDFMELYHYGHSVLNDYLRGAKTAGEVFDVDKMARYYALIEIGHGLHAQLITNIRFYVNPATGLLEPIGYDFFGDHMPNVNEQWRPVGQWENGKDIIARSRDGYGYMRRLFGDLDFYEKYMIYLVKYSSATYLSGVEGALQSNIDSRESLIRSDEEYAGYSYDFATQFRKAGYTRSKIYPLADVSLKSYRSIDKSKVYVQGYHYFPLEVIGYSSRGNQTMLDQPIILDAYSPASSLETYGIEISGRADALLYKTLGVDSIFVHQINDDILPTPNIDTHKSKLKSLSENLDILVDGDTYSAKSGTLTLNEAYLVEAGKTLLLPKGLLLSLAGAGSLTVYGKILAIGSASEPILISGTSQRGQGILIKGDSESHLIHCQISSLGAYQVGAIKLPSAFYIDNNKVLIANCSFSNNKSEVDLYLVNSECQISNTHFSLNAGSAIRSTFTTLDIDHVSGSRYGGVFLQQTGGRTTGNGISCVDILDACLITDLHAVLNISDFSLQSCSKGISASGNSDVMITGYKGAAEHRDIEVTGSARPATSVRLVNAVAANDLKYIMEPGTSLIINGSKKITK